MFSFVLGQWTGLFEMGEEELKALRAPSEKAVLRAALLFEREVKKKLIGPRTGRMYGSHQASAPGEPPAALSGDLRKSITHSMPEWIDDEVSAEVGSAMPYAQILELGGYTGHARILPRPYLSATFLEQYDAMQAILDKAANS